MRFKTFSIISNGEYEINIKGNKIHIDDIFGGIEEKVLFNNLSNDINYRNDLLYSQAFRIANPDLNIQLTTTPVYGFEKMKRVMNMLYNIIETAKKEGVKVCVEFDPRIYSYKEINGED